MEVVTAVKRGGRERFTGGQRFNATSVASPALNSVLATRLENPRAPKCRRRVGDVADHERPSSRTGFNVALGDAQAHRQRSVVVRTANPMRTVEGSRVEPPHVSSLGGDFATEVLPVRLRSVPRGRPRTQSQTRCRQSPMARVNPRRHGARRPY